MSIKLNKAILVLSLIVSGFTTSMVAQDLIQTVVPPSVIFEALTINRDLGTKMRPKYRSPAVLLPSFDKKQIFIAEQSAKKIAVYDLTLKQITKRYNLPNEVTGMCLSKDGTKLYVTCGSDQWPSGTVCQLNIATGLIEKRITDKIGYYPRSPVLTNDGSKLYICNMFSNDISIINVASFTATAKLPVVREPYCAVITPPGVPERLIIGNSLPNDRSTDSAFVSCEITVWDVATDKALKHQRLTRGSHSVFGIAVSPDGKYAFASHLIGKFNLVGTTVAAGWLHTNNIAVIDIISENMTDTHAINLVNDVSFDLSTEGRANPWDIKFTDATFPGNDTFMVIAHAGSNHLSMVRYGPFMDSVLFCSKNKIDMQQNFKYLTESVRKSVDINSKGTRAVCIIGEDAFTTGFFDDTGATMEQHQITLKTKRTEVRPVVYHKIGKQLKQTGERRGELYFYDADLCFQQWQSCQSCHPLTRPDALNWILNSGVAGTSKNAKSMVYAWWTPPTTWTGRRMDAHESIVAGIQLELFMQASSDVSYAMDTFFMYIKPMSSPFLEKGRFSEKAKRGRALYYDVNKVDCIKCHKGPMFYDEKVYQCGVPDPFDASAMNTPVLTEMWRTMPYGHLGNYTGMSEIFMLDGHSNLQSNVAAGKLTALEVNGKSDLLDLIEFVNSL